MGSKGGGSVDTSGLEEATMQATELQRQIYEETREDVQPWYNMGTGAVSQLSDLLGIGGGSVQTRDQIYNELSPQYTTQQAQAQAGGGQWQGLGGALYGSREDAIADAIARGNLGGDSISKSLSANALVSEYAPAPQYQDVVDYSGLNAAVDARFSNQGTPDNYGSLLQTFGMDQFEADPGYQFRVDEANTALERQMAAQGVTLGGGGYGEINPQAYRAMTELNQNLGSEEYSNAYNRYTNDQLNTFNMLMGASGSGQAVTNQMAAAGDSYATNTGNLTTSLAQAQFQAEQAAAAQPSMFDSLLSAGAGVAGAYYGSKSDIRAKESIIEIEPENGHKMYEFSYKGDPKRYIGVMAQDVQKTHPDAVKDIDGVLHVDYSQLGVEMREA